MGVILQTSKGLKLEKESAKQDQKKKKKEECRGADPAHMIFFFFLTWTQVFRCLQVSIFS
jgi:ribosomal protein S25